MFSGKEYPTSTNARTTETIEFLDGASKAEILEFVQPAVEKNKENLKKAAEEAEERKKAAEEAKKTQS